MTETNPQLNLPAPIAAYFEADRLDGEATARCFARDAVVTDEGHTHIGVDAIRAWKDASNQRYACTSTPTACVEEDGVTVVTSHTVGNFPGSPLDLRYFFRLEGGEITALTVTL